MRKTAFLGALLLAACTNMSVRTGSGGLPNPDGSSPGIMGRDDSVATMPGNRTTRRTVCRSQGIPRSWVAVDYVADSRNCGGSPQAPYSAMVLQALAPLPVGTVLTVCRGQTTPINWQRDDATENSSGQCPRNPGDRDTGPTTMTITRLR
jgi:hypothetical protein